MEELSDAADAAEEIVMPGAEKVEEIITPVPEPLSRKDHVLH